MQKVAEIRCLDDEAKFVEVGTRCDVVFRDSKYYIKKENHFHYVPLEEVNLKRWGWLPGKNSRWMLIKSPLSFPQLVVGEIYTSCKIKDMWDFSNNEIQPRNIFNNSDCWMPVVNEDEFSLKEEFETQVGLPPWIHDTRPTASFDDINRITKELCAGHGTAVNNLKGKYDA